MNRLLLMLMLAIVLLFPVTLNAKTIDPETRIVINDNDTLDYGAVNRTSYGGLTVLEFGSKEKAKKAYKEIVKYYPNAFIDKPIYFAGNSSNKNGKNGKNGKNNSLNIKISGALDIGAVNAIKYNDFGNKKVIVAMIDSGLTPKNSIFKGRKISDKGINLVTNTRSYDDMLDHGTPVAGIIVACTPKNVELLPINIFDSNYQSTVSLLMLGINYAIDNRADVINLSVNARTDDLPQVEELLKKAYEKNILVFVSTGNNANDKVLYPASSKYTIAVGSYDAENGNRSYAGNYGDGLDFVAPGDFVRSVNNKGGTEKYIGTSFAAPHMSACGAWLKLVDKNITVKQAYKALKVKAKDRGKKGWDKYHGWGSPRINYSVNYLFRKQFKGMKNFKRLPRNFYVKYSKKYTNIYRKKDKYLFYKKKTMK